MILNWDVLLNEIFILPLTLTLMMVMSGISLFFVNEVNVKRIITFNKDKYFVCYLRQNNLAKVNRKILYVFLAGLLLDSSSSSSSSLEGRGGDDDQEGMSSVVTPCLLAAINQLLSNLVVMVPNDTFTSMSSHNILNSLIRSVPCLWILYALHHAQQRHIQEHMDSHAYTQRYLHMCACM